MSKKSMLTVYQNVYKISCVSSGLKNSLPSCVSVSIFFFFFFFTGVSLMSISMAEPSFACDCLEGEERSLVCLCVCVWGGGGGRERGPRETRSQYDEQERKVVRSSVSGGRREALDT